MKKNKLTPRQKQILCLSSQGETYEEIAKKLDISENTVRSHLVTIRLIFDVKNSRAASFLAISEGIISY